MVWLLTLLLMPLLLVVPLVVPLVVVRSALVDALEPQPASASAAAVSRIDVVCAANRTGADRQVSGNRTQVREWRAFNGPARKRLPLVGARREEARR